jgi:hypothetical protein
MNYLRKTIIVAVGALALSWLSGCASRSFFIASPPGFVELQDQEPEYSYRATSADGVVVGVREIKHQPKGDTTFWVQAIQNRMRSMAGYAQLDSVDITTKSGLKGKQLRFGHDEKGDALLYTITVFVTEKYIYLVEFGGAKEEMSRMSKNLDWVVENFRVN